MKRPVFGASLTSVLSGKPEAQETLRARPLRRPGKDKVSLTFNVSPAMYLKLQEIKIARGTSIQALLEEAADIWLKSLGETGFKPRSE